MNSKIFLLPSILLPSLWNWQNEGYSGHTNSSSKKTVSLASHGSSGISYHGLQNALKTVIRLVSSQLLCSVYLCVVATTQAVLFSQFLPQSSLVRVCMCACVYVWVFSLSSDSTLNFHLGRSKHKDKLHVPWVVQSFLKSLLHAPAQKTQNK